MKTAFLRNQLAGIVALAILTLGLSSHVQAHPELAETKWKEINGPYDITFEKGKEIKKGEWEGEWKGTLHHDKKEHLRGKYVLKMESESKGKLVLLEEGKELCAGEVHFEGIRSTLKFGAAEYRREKK